MFADLTSIGEPPADAGSALLFLVGVVAVLWGVSAHALEVAFDKGIWFAGAGTVRDIGTAAWQFSAIRPNIIYRPQSITRWQTVMTVALEVMAYVSIAVPFVRTIYMAQYRQSQD